MISTEQLLQNERDLRGSAERMLAKTQLLERLKPLGNVVPMGSFVTRLMTWPDLDISIGTTHPDPVDLMATGVSLYEKIPEVYKFTFANLERQNPGSNTYYLGLQVLFEKRDWKVDITMTTLDKVGSDPRLVKWLKTMTPDQRVDILRLKTDLVEGHRYLGAKSVPPKSFRSIHLYEGVFEGNAKSIADLESYFD